MLSSNPLMLFPKVYKIEWGIPEDKGKIARLWPIHTLSYNFINPTHSAGCSRTSLGKPMAAMDHLKGLASFYCVFSVLFWFFFFLLCEYLPSELQHLVPRISASSTGLTCCYISSLLKTRHAIKIWFWAS